MLALALWSIWTVLSGAALLDPPVAISMRRGLSSSGTSRTRSTVSRPLWRDAPCHLDVVRQVEALLEGAGRNPVMEVLRSLRFRSSPADDDQRVFVLRSSISSDEKPAIAIVIRY